MTPPLASASLPDPGDLGAAGLQRVTARLSQTLQRDQLVQSTLEQLRAQFQVDRVVLYYFYERWRGQVTSEALADPSLSILGSTGADECFNDTYAEQYLQGRIRAIADITTAGLEPCHLEFLQGLHVRANLVAPVLAQHSLWGLLVAHHCRSPRPWQADDLAAMQAAATHLAQSSGVQASCLPTA
jgi:GAF domain-containing protein